MKKSALLATAVALILSGSLMAAGTTTPATTTTTTKVAATTKPTQDNVTTTTTVTDTSKTVPAKKAAIDATTETVTQKATVTNKGGDIGSANVTQTTVFFTVTGASKVSTDAEYMKLADHLKKAKGVFSANCTFSNKQCSAVIDPAQTNADQILSWAEKGQYKLMKK